MEHSLSHVFAAQQERQHALRMTNAKERIAKLRRLKQAIAQYEDRLFEALQEDLRKNKQEAALTEVYFIYSEIDHAIKQLESWMAKKRKAFTLTSFLSSNWIQYEPLGNALIIAPWNYPFQLSMSPLVSAIAAGCTAILKPSEYSPRTAAMMQRLIRETFPKEEVDCFLGEKEVAIELLKLPFHKIFFTGSPEVGKQVMKAGAEHLANITLELGGKSPVVIGPDADIYEAATKIAWGKLINAGQTCIAPDYLYLPEDAIFAFCQAYQAAINRMFAQADIMYPERYAKIINSRHKKRLEALLLDAQQRNAIILWEGKVNEEDSLPPSLIAGLSPDSKLMQEEIFGPILPIIPYKNLKEVITHIQAKPKPLAMYIFAKNNKFINQLTQACSSGSVCINDVLIQVSNPNLPFGGVNHSGLGSCHGFYGFKAFSHERAMMKQTRFSLSAMIYPPYQGKDRLFNLLKRWM